MVRANVVDSIPECLTTGQVPSIQELPEFSHIDLADPDYGKESRIDVLLDVEYYFPCLREGIIHSQTHSIILSLAGFLVEDLSLILWDQSQSHSSMKFRSALTMAQGHGGNARGDLFSLSKRPECYEAL